MLCSATAKFLDGDRVTGPRGVGRILGTRFIHSPGRPLLQYVVVAYDGGVGDYAESVELVSKVEVL